jgi:NAD(P) transhydrogenase subunit alpha
MDSQESINSLIQQAQSLADQSAALSNSAVTLTEDIINTQIVSQQTVVVGVDPLIFGLTVFVLAVFVGYYVVWKVTPALHTPLMSVTNAVSSIIVIGALIAAGATGVVTEPGVVFAGGETSSLFGIAALFLASVNIFGGFIVTQRMLGMFKKKDAS